MRKIVRFSYFFALEVDVVSLRDFSPKMTRIFTRQAAWHTRYSARSGGLFTQPQEWTPFSSANVRMKRNFFRNIDPSKLSSFSPFAMSFTMTLPTEKFVKGVIAAENRALYKSGAYIRRAMKTVLNKKRPRRYTKSTEHKPAGSRRHTARYKKEILSGTARAPYKKWGTLRDNVFFAVDKKNGYVVIGPTYMPHLRAYQTTRSAKTIPDLLNTGGPATVLHYQNHYVGQTGKNLPSVKATRRKKRYKNVNFKPHPFVRMTWKKSKRVVMGEIMKDVINPVTSNF